MAATPYIRWFRELGRRDLALVGGKNASLGEMVRELSPRGIRVPDGFAVTAQGYWDFLDHNRMRPEIEAVLRDLDIRDIAELNRCGQAVRALILKAEMPPALESAIVSAYACMDADRREAADVAVRSSATAEDLPEASFAGQQETYLNVQGAAQLLDACKRCYASLFTDRAIAYRIHHGFDYRKVALSIGIQKMVRSDLGAAGVMFSLDTETGFPDVVFINAAYGLGESVVQGTVNPDEYYVFKPTLGQGFQPILKRTLGSKEFKLIYDVGGNKWVRSVPVASEERTQFALSESDILQLARWACLIESHYGTPMDMEWAKDGKTGELFIVQARPETVHARKNRHMLETYRMSEKGGVLLSGRSVGAKVASGRVRVISDRGALSQFQPGEILVADKTDPDWEPVMKKAAAIVTNRGGRTCHAAIVSRELGLPAVIGTEKATDLLQDGQMITVSCAEGETGFVYDGALPYDVETVDLQGIAKPKTKIMLNIANPDRAFALSALPVDGVGLMREEFITSAIGLHPMALVHYDSLEPGDKAQIDHLTLGYADKPQYFVDRLAEGVATIAAAFYPRDVILRFSDYKTNEYADLVGGKAYEPHEENPMLGFRGASRYYSPRYQAGFALECRAIRKVREEMGLCNLKVMIPFCRTVEEGRKVIAEMAQHGLRRGENGLDIYVMCEIPSNVILAAEFAEIFDGFSIGSNDLTQLVLGVDRDSEVVAPLFDERNPAVQAMIAEVIRTAKAKGRKIGICGQAPSDYPEFAQFLVEQGIDSISLNPDAVLKTIPVVLAAEANNAR